MKTARFRNTQLKRQAIPLWACCQGMPDRWPVGEDWLDVHAGRILWPIPAERNPLPGELDWLVDIVTERDIVWVPLYQENLSYPTPHHWPPTPLPDYGELWQLCREIAPKVHGLMLGNNGCELLYRRLVRIEGQNAFGIDARASVYDMATFVDTHARACESWGTRLFVGTMDWGVLHDCYQAGGQLAATCARYGVPQICTCGFTLLPDTWYKPHPLMGGQRLFAAECEGNSEDFPRLREFISSGGYWSGVNGLAGVEAGNVGALASYGFKAGIIGG